MKLKAIQRSGDGLLIELEDGSALSVSIGDLRQALLDGGCDVAVFDMRMIREAMHGEFNPSHEQRLFMGTRGGQLRPSNVETFPGDHRGRVLFRGAPATATVTHTEPEPDDS